MAGERRKRKWGIEVVGRSGKSGKEVYVMVVLVDA